MYSREESQRIKREFWVAFAEKYPRKWVLYDTKIKDFSFKFFVDNKKAQVLIDIEQRSDEKRIAYFEKLEALKTILEEEFVSDLVFEKDYYLMCLQSVAQSRVRHLPPRASRSTPQPTACHPYRHPPV